MNKKRDYVLDTQNMNGKSIKKKSAFLYSNNSNSLV